jgi:hypothetical protein
MMMDELDYNMWPVSALDDMIAERNSRYGKAGGVLLNTGGLKADKVKTLERDDSTMTVPDSGITANAVRELDDEAKTGAVRRREAREARLTEEAEAWEKHHAGEDE